MDEGLKAKILSTMGELSPAQLDRVGIQLTNGTWVQFRDGKYVNALGQQVDCSVSDIAQCVWLPEGKSLADHAGVKTVNVDELVSQNTKLSAQLEAAAKKVVELEGQLAESKKRVIEQSKELADYRKKLEEALRPVTKPQAAQPQAAQPQAAQPQAAQPQPPG